MNENSFLELMNLITAGFYRFQRDQWNYWRFKFQIKLIRQAWYDFKENKNCNSTQEFIDIFIKFAFLYLTDKRITAEGDFYYNLFQSLIYVFITKNRILRIYIKTNDGYLFKLIRENFVNGPFLEKYE